MYQQSLVVILPSMEIYMGCIDVKQNIDCLMLICCGFLGVLKMTWFRIYPNSLIISYNSALRDYQTINNTKERDIMRKHAFIGRIISSFLLSMAYFCCLTYGIISILDYNINNRINVTNEDTTLEYVIPSRCALEYFNFPTSMYKICCLVETAVIILVSTANIGNYELIFCISYFMSYLHQLPKIKIKVFLLIRIPYINIHKNFY